MNSNTKYLQFESNNSSEALNDVKNKGADQIRVCTEKINMASDFAKSRTLTVDFSVNKTIWAEIFRKQSIEVTIFYINTTCFGSEFPFKLVKYKIKETAHLYTIFDVCPFELFCLRLA